MARLAIRMPKMSMTMTEGEMGEWKVSVGDEIGLGDVVCEVLTDKVDMEVESTVAGTLVEIVHDSGTVPVGEPIGWVDGEDDGGGFGDLLIEPEPSNANGQPASAESEAAEPDAPNLPESTGVEPSPRVQHERLETHTQHVEPQLPDVVPSVVRTPPVAAVPRARGLASEHGLDLRAVAGTGPAGLVRVRDVEALIGVAPDLTGVPVAGRTLARVAGRSSVSDDGRYTRVRAAIARAMEPSVRIPQFTVWRELQLDAADVARRGASWTAVLIRAYAVALRHTPELLTRWEGDHAAQLEAPDIALAVAGERGLLAPTITAPDLLSLADLDKELKLVAAAARQGRVDREYLDPAGATFSNLGGQGVDRFQPLLTPGQASVLALGTIRRRPVAVPGGVGSAITVHLGLTVDHRLADGVHAANCLRDMNEFLGGGA